MNKLLWAAVLMLAVVVGVQAYAVNGLRGELAEVRERASKAERMAALVDDRARAAEERLQQMTAQAVAQIQAAAEAQDVSAQVSTLEDEVADLHAAVNTVAKLRDDVDLLVTEVWGPFAAAPSSLSRSRIDEADECVDAILRGLDGGYVSCPDF